MKERRKTKRRSPTTYVGVVNRETNEPIGYLADLTTDGMRLMNNEPIKSGVILRLRIKVNDIEYILLDVQSRWCKKNEKSNTYEIGFKIQNISPDNLKKVKQLIARPLFKDLLQQSSLGLY